MEIHINCILQHSEDECRGGLIIPHNSVNPQKDTNNFTGYLTKENNFKINKGNNPLFASQENYEAKIQVLKKLFLRLMWW